MTPCQHGADRGTCFLCAQDERRHLVLCLFLALMVALTWFIVIIAPRRAHPSPLDCEAIRDADRRHFCRAITKHDPTECEFIRARDLRAECRARVKVGYDPR